MRVPFHNELDEVFRSDRSLWVKMAGCSFVSIFVVLASTVKGIKQGRLDVSLTTSVLVALTLIAALLGPFICLLLALKDTIERRIDRGDKVHPILRMYFARARLSLSIWFLSILIASLFVTTTGLILGFF